MSFQVPESEITIRASRSGGPGGQRVNKVSTRVEAVWNLHESAALSEPRRVRLLTALASRLDGHGNLRVVASDSRSQARNRDAAIERLRATVARALIVPRKRVPTKPGRTAVERRLDEKKRRGARKRERRAPPDD